MANQMKSAEMRERAKRLWDRIMAHADSATPGYCPECTDMSAGAEALDALADVIEHAESVMRERSDTISRGMRVDMAETLLDIARGKTDEKEKEE